MSDRTMTEEKGVSREGAESLQGLFHLERAAAAHYARVLEKVTSKEKGGEFERLRGEHERAARRLAERLRACGLSVNGGEEVQRNVATILEVAARPASDPAALGALRESEEQIITDYENGVSRGGWDEQTLRLVKTELLPEARQRLPVLEARLSAA